MAIELQTVDDGRRVVEQDVLGPQVAVRLDHAPAAAPASSQSRWPRQEVELRAHRASAAAASSLASTVWLASDLRLKACREYVAPRRSRAARRVEGGAASPSDEVGGGRATAREQHVQHAAAVETAHLHEPVDDFASPLIAKCAAGSQGERARAPR